VILINKFPLKDRERHVAELLCNKGLNGKEIADKIGISHRHVRRIISDLKDHYDAENIAQLGSLWILDNIYNEIPNLDNFVDTKNGIEIKSKKYNLKNFISMQGCIKVTNKISTLNNLTNTLSHFKFKNMNINNDKIYYPSLLDTLNTVR
jgi:DNA-binding CsgD family transcriptional regulator